MAVHIRLQRKGATHRPFYHLVAADHRSPRDGKYLEKLGYYDPNVEPSTVVVKSDRIQHWYNRGAQLSHAASKLLKAQKIELAARGQEKKPSKKAAAEPKAPVKAKEAPKEATAKKATAKKATAKKAPAKKTASKKKASTKKASTKKASK